MRAEEEVKGFQSSVYMMTQDNVLSVVIYYEVQLFFFNVGATKERWLLYTFVIHTGHNKGLHNLKGYNTL